LTNILLVMHRKVAAEAYARAIQEYAGFSAYCEYDYADAAMTAKVRKADITIIEVPESQGRQLAQYVEICAAIRRVRPESKFMLLCSERSREGVQLAVAAMQSKEIDDYVFYDSTLDYFLSKLAVLSTGGTEDLE